MIPCNQGNVHEGESGWFVPQAPARHLNQNSFASGSDEFPRHYQALLQTADPVASARSMRGLFAEPLKQFEHNIRFDHLDFSLHDPVRNVLVAHPLLQKGTFEIPGEVPVAGSLELVLRQHHTIEVRDVETKAGFTDARAIAQKGGFSSFRVIPLTTEDAPSVPWRSGGCRQEVFSEEDIRFVHHVAEPASATRQCLRPTDSQSEQLPQLLRLRPAHRNLGLLLIVHAQLIRTFEPRHHFFNTIGID